MAKLTRVTGKVFAGSAASSQVGQFGSALAGNPTNTTDIATIQSLSAYTQGWGSAVISSRNFPPLEEVNGVLKTISYQGCYLLQEGIPEYDSNTEYSNTSIVKDISGTQLTLYVSLQNSNINHALTDSDWWAQVTFLGSSPIGAPQITLNFNATLPTNCIWLEGAEVSRTTYSALFGIYGTSYGEGDGSTTFTLPDFRDRVIWGGTTAGYIEAGLPDIICPEWNEDGIINNHMASGGSKSENVTWSASAFNSIYGNSNTVQPPSIKCRVYTRYQ